MMMFIRYALALLYVTICLFGCSRQQQGSDVTADSSADSNTAVTGYSALDTGVVGDWEKDPHLSALVGKFPKDNLVEGSFDFTPRGFLDIESVDQVITAEYVVGDDSLTLFLTEDNSGMKYLRFTEFAAQQSQVWPAAAEFEFDEGYSAIFHHHQLARVLGGLKSGYLLGAVSYQESSTDFVSQWVKAVE